MISRRFRVWADESGASAVEFALLLPLLVLFLFGILQFGLFYYRAQGVEAAAREGARIAAIGGSPADVQTRVIDAAPPFIDPTHLSVSVEVFDKNASDTDLPLAGVTQCQEVGQRVEVEVSVVGHDEYAIVIPLWDNKDINFYAVGVFRCEQVGP